MKRKDELQDTRNNFSPLLCIFEHQGENCLGGCCNLPFGELGLREFAKGNANANRRKSLKFILVCWSNIKWFYWILIKFTKPTKHCTNCKLSPEYLNKIIVTKIEIKMKNQSWLFVLCCKTTLSELSNRLKHTTN